MPTTHFSNISDNTSNNAYTFHITQSTSWQSTFQSKSNWQIPDTPFMDFRFWEALRDSDALGKKAGWVENYVLIKENDKLLAVMPVFVKHHNRGEFVFDHAWTEAFNRYGFDYYPRLVTSAPYSPITGQRMWLANINDNVDNVDNVDVELTADIVHTALQGVNALAEQVKASTWHGLYFDKNTVDLSQQDNPLLERQGCQFQWFNQHLSEDNRQFTDFDDFLSTFTAKKRKNIRQERKKIAKQNLSIRRLVGEHITTKDWEVFYQCYAMTYLVRGQRPYLSLGFFVQLGETMPEHVMLAQGINEYNEVMASALFFYDRPTTKTPMLYGRYWGALAEFDSLHFELCYYQGIEFAIEQGLQVFDPGTQGEHKLVRGFVPTVTHSLHQVYHEAFVEPINNFCREERVYMAEYRKQAFESLPFNIDNMPDNPPDFDSL